MMSREELFELLWDGTLPMEDWTAFVTGGAVTPIAGDIISVHTTYFCGSVTVVRTPAGLVFVDTGNPGTSAEMLAQVRRWDDRPVHTVIYTQGHIDHTSGVKLIDAEAEARGEPKPRVIAHRGVLARFDRYDATHGYNSIVQGHQFNRPGYAYPTPHRRPDEVYDDQLSISVGGVRLELHHGRGETDDATYVWLPQERVLVAGDFAIWAFPNAGNPRKVQRYAAEWAANLRKMQALRPAVLVPGHGPVVFGEVRADQMLGDTAAVVERLVSDTLQMINRGCTLDEILQTVSVPKEALEKPYLFAKYDDPEFVVRGIWHLYAGWFDGNVAHLKPARDAELAIELSTLVGGAARLAARAVELAEQGQTRLAVHLAEFAGQAAPEDKSIQAARARVLHWCAEGETSLIGRNLFAAFQREAESRS